VILVVMGEDLLETYREAAEIVREEQSTPPQACPHDGTPLESGSDGVLHCRFDGYEWPRDGRLI
jgi:hypothetical protein